MLRIGSMLALVLSLGLAIAPSVSDAKRLGGGKSVGMQRATTPDKAAPPAPATPAATPNNAATPANAAAPNPAAAAAATPKRSWMGPLAGLAAGLGLAALFSHLGMGEGFANFMMLALLAVLTIVVVRWLIGRFAGGTSRASMPFAMAGGTAAGGSSGAFGSGGGVTSALPTPPVPVAATLGPALPADFDAAAFERIAKMIFIRLQAAHDSGDLNDLRAFTTPEMFAEVRLDLQERGASTQKTDVVTVDAQLIDFAQEADRQVVSVRFSGLMREDVGAEAAPFDEVWHLVKPLDDSRNWAIAGIQQRQ